MNDIKQGKHSTSRRGSGTNLGLGLLFVIAGILLFSRQYGVDLPDWLFRWEMIVIAVGLGVGLKSGFRDFGWIAIIGVGLFFLADDVFPEWNASRYFVPIALVFVGLVILRNRFISHKPVTSVSSTINETGFEQQYNNTTPAVLTTDAPVSSADPGDVEMLNVAAVFSGINKQIFSKNFGGGEIVSVFGGSDIDLMNADISQGPIELEVVCIFGGATLYIPSNWYIKSELTSIFGGVDDKRKNVVPDHSRVLIIKGVFVFGGMEIKTRIK
jgi:predicted membrane protein